MHNKRKIKTKKILYKLDDKNNTYIVIPTIKAIREICFEDRVVGIHIEYINETSKEICECDYRDFNEPGLTDVIKKDIENILDHLNKYFENNVQDKASELTQLLPCPFCGGEPAFGRGVNYYFVNCTDCLCSTNRLLAEQHMPTKLEAMEAWNLRVG